MNKNVKELLENHMWDLATCLDNKPNVVLVAFKEVTEDGKLVIGDVFLDTTLKNIAGNNGSIAISVYDDKKLEGYQIKGTASYTTSGVLGGQVQEDCGRHVPRCCHLQRHPDGHPGNHHRHHPGPGK